MSPAVTSSRSSGRRRTALSLAAAVLLAALIAALVLSGPSGRRLLVSPAGSIAHAGPAASSFHSVARALSAARPGDTITLRAGTYGRRGERLTIATGGKAGAPVTIEGPSTGPPAILGAVRVLASHVVLTHLHFRGPTGPVLPTSGTDPSGEEVLVSSYGDDVTLESDEVAGDAWHAGVFIGHGRGVRITRSYIHDNGNFSDPAQANLDHGIYWASGSGLISDNLIVHNVAHGVQLYPGAGPVTVSQNTIADNGKSGVIISADSSANTIVNNIVVRNADNGIRSADLKGRDNVVTRNLIWANGGGNLGTYIDRLALRNNIVADPRFASPDGFGLKPASPALRAGAPRYSTSRDVQGRARDEDHPTLGAIESR